MKTNIKTWNLSTVKRREARINPQPQYQRTGVWSDKKNQLLIDTILRGYDIPKIYLTNSTDKKYEHEVIDGQQRLKAIWGFYDNAYPLGSESIDLPIGDFSGKKYKDLSSDIQDELDLYELSIVIIEQSTEIEVRDLFLRLQEGVTLNTAEKRNAMTGNMRDFIADLTSHKVFQCVPSADKRFKYADWLSHVVCLELADGATDIKAKDLKEMYQNRQNFNVDSKEAKNIKKVLNYIYDSFVEITPELSVQWGFIDFYLLISLLTKEYILKHQNQGFASFYIGFEQERRAVEDAAELIEQRNAWAKDLYDYIEAFSPGGVRKNIETRNRVYTNKLFREIINLETEDSKRLFDQNQKTVIWRRGDGKCKICNTKVDANSPNFHADHIIPHSKGGKTTIENGQVLCAGCNATKGAT